MWSYVIVLKNPLFTENGQTEAGAGASQAIRNLFEYLLVILFQFLYVFQFEVLFKALNGSFVTFESLKDHFMFLSSSSPSATSRRGRPEGSAGLRQGPQVSASSATPQGSADSRQVPKSLCSVADFLGTPVPLNNIQAHLCLKLHHFAPC